MGGKKGGTGLPKISFAMTKNGIDGINERATTEERKVPSCLLPAAIYSERARVSSRRARMEKCKSATSFPAI